MVSDVQEWLDAPAGNHGWMLYTPENIAGNARRFDSRENLDPSARPRLTITFFPPPPPECPADFNNVGGVTVQDVFDFLADWISQSSGGPVNLASADFNGTGGVTVQDIFDFLAAWNAGCP
jgi:hypothetical protein